MNQSQKHAHRGSKYEGNVDVVGKDGRTPLQVVRSAQVVQYLIEKGADVDHRSDGGLTAMDFFFLQDFVPSTRVLLEADADVNAVKSHGMTPLFLAVNSQPRNIEMITLLQQYSARID